jgi:hypothetical protein
MPLVRKVSEVILNEVWGRNRDSHLAYRFLALQNKSPSSDTLSEEQGATVAVRLTVRIN